MSARGTAFFIEPTGSLRATICKRKALLEARLPGQAYTRHPPHGTLLFGQWDPPSAWPAVAAQAVGRIPRFTLSTDAWQLFPNDALAGGGHTVALRAVPSPALARLQLGLAEALAPFVRRDLPAHPLAHKEPFAASLRRYGSPFVGSHWIPHFTIGSPRVAPDDPLLALLMDGPAGHTMEVSHVSVWMVEGDTHTPLSELALA